SPTQIADSLFASVFRRLTRPRATSPGEAAADNTLLVERSAARCVARWSVDRARSLSLAAIPPTSRAVDRNVASARRSDGVKVKLKRGLTRKKLYARKAITAADRAGLTPNQ